MQRQLLTDSAMFLILVGLVASSLIGGEAGPNLVANPSFEKVEKAKVGEDRHVPSNWRFFVIALEAAGSVDPAAPHTGQTSFRFALDEKGKGFLHSEAFDVTPGVTYQVSAWIKGQGALGLEMLWWQSYLENLQRSEHHRDVCDPQGATPDWKRITTTFTAPADAKRAYLRLVGVKGNLWVDDVAVTAQ